MFEKTTLLSEFPVIGCKCEDLTLLHFYLQMLNDENAKTSWNSLRWKYQLYNHN